VKSRSQLVQNSLSNILHNLLTTTGAALLGISLTASALAATENVLYSFTAGNGAWPAGDLIFDDSGNLYGMTITGGKQNSATCADGCGIVYKLSPSSDGGWRSTILYRFSQTEGMLPQNGLVRDHSGNLYGTTPEGGPDGNGVVFELSPTPTGTWKYTVLYSFPNPSTGESPHGRLIVDASGSLYGTTAYDGSNWGVVFKLSPALSGEWKYAVLYTFTGGSDGGSPENLIFDALGNLYGPATNGGDNTDSDCNPNQFPPGCGVAFKLSPDSEGQWTETVLYTFTGVDGRGPIDRLVFDASGNLYGATTQGGDFSGCGGLGCGVVYELSPRASGPWKESVLLTFQPGASGYGNIGGGEPETGLTFDAAGNLFGTTYVGGIGPGYRGVVFELSPNSAEGWTETLVHAFTSGADGANPLSPLTFDAAGNLFGATQMGGIDSDCERGCGVVFQITP
jgi:hypothetical protein